MRVAAFVLAALLVLAAGGCGPRAVGDGLPPGVGIAGDGAAWRTVLAGAATLEGTPLATAATRLGGVLEGCDRFAAFCPAGDGCDLVARVACDGGVNAPEARRLLDLAADAPLAAFAAAPDGPRLLARRVARAGSATAPASPPACSRSPA